MDSIPVALAAACCLDRLDLYLPWSQNRDMGDAKQKQDKREAHPVFVSHAGPETQPHESVSQVTTLSAPGLDFETREGSNPNGHSTR